MSETRFFWVKCWALEMLGTANVAMARATESFAYFERHGMDCIPSRRSFSVSEAVGTRQAAGLVDGARALSLGGNAPGDAGGQWESSAQERGERHEKVKTGSLSRRGEGEAVYSSDI